MKILYTDHLKTRLKQRKIPANLVKEIFDNAKEFYWDTWRNHRIRIGKVYYRNKLRKLLLAYDKIDEENVEIITLHPITDGEIKQRIISGRWIDEKTN